jgi:hypothetical protein
MEFMRSGWPALRKVHLSDIHSGAYVLEHKKCILGPIPGRTIRAASKKEHIVSVVTDVCLWPKSFYNWAKELPDELENL